MIKNAVFIDEVEPKKLTSIPGEVASVTNIAPLYGFGGEMGNLASFLCGHHKKFLISNIREMRLSKEIDDATFVERLAYSYVLNRHLVLETGYDSFDSRVGEVFLRYYAYEMLRRRGEGSP